MTTTLPPSLDRFESQLRAAIRHERNRRPRRIAIRAGAVAAATAAAAIGALTLLPGSGQSAVARAAAALSQQDGSILHVVMVDTSKDETGAATTTRIETWGQTSAPYNQRGLMTHGDQRLEFATVDGRVQLYDASTNTIYTAPVDTPGAIGKAGQPDTPDGDRYRSKILGLLDSGSAHEDGHATVDGRDAVRIISSDRMMTLFVDATTFDPIEWTITNGGGSIDRTQFPTFEHLSASDATALSLVAQHPNATVNNDPAAYAEAAPRLSGKPATDDGSSSKDGSGKAGAGQPPTDKP